MYRIFRTAECQKLFEQLGKFEQERVANFEQHLKNEPLSGKPLGFKFFREKKFNGKRLLFLVYPAYETIFVIQIVDKKTQQKVINFTKENLALYRESIEKKLKEIKSL